MIWSFECFVEPPYVPPSFSTYSPLVHGFPAFEPVVYYRLFRYPVAESSTLPRPLLLLLLRVPKEIEDRLPVEPDSLTPS